MEGHAVDLLRAWVDARCRGHTPLVLAKADPTRKRTSARQNSIQEDKGFGRQIQQTLTCRQPHALRAESGHKGRVAVSNKVTWTVAYRCRTSCRSALVRLRQRGIGFSHAVDCAPVVQVTQARQATD